jgi:hypothetical protein
MQFIVITAAFSCFFYTVAAGSEHVLRVPDTGPYKVAVYGHTGFLPEKRAKICGVETGHRCHPLYGNFFPIAPGYIINNHFNTGIFQGKKRRAEEKFKKAVKDEQENSLGFNRVEGGTVGPHIEQFMEKTNEIIVNTGMINKRERKLRVFLFRTFKDKLSGKAAHKAFGPGNGGPEMARRQAEEVPRGEVIRRTVDGIAYGAFGDVGNVPKRRDVFLNMPHGDGLPENAIIYIGGDSLVYAAVLG